MSRSARLRKVNRHQAGEKLTHCGAMAGRCALKMLKLVRVIGDPPSHKATADKRVTATRAPVSVDGPPKRKAHRRPLSQISRSYFGTGSDAKFAWTNIHLLSFFTNTRVDFARFGVVFPSLSMVRPT